MTQLPTRPISKEFYIRSLNDNIHVDDASVIDLLRRVQLRFDQEEVETAAQLLHYTDITLDDPLSSDSSSVRAFAKASTDVNDEQWKVPRKHHIQPPIPVRPSEETIAKMMDVSYVEWDDASYEDTTADSRLADWLATFADPNPDISNVANETRPTEFSQSLHVHFPEATKRGKSRPKLEEVSHQKLPITPHLQHIPAQELPIKCQTRSSRAKRHIHRRTISAPTEFHLLADTSVAAPLLSAKSPSRSFSERLSDQFWYLDGQKRCNVSSVLDTPMTNTSAQSPEIYTPLFDFGLNGQMVGGIMSPHGEDSIEEGNYSECLGSLFIFDQSFSIRLQLWF